MDVEPTRTIYGKTEAIIMAHGIEVAFEALPSSWQQGDEVEIEFADGPKLRVFALPEYGPTTFGWNRGPTGQWHIRLEPIRQNVLQVSLEEQHRDLLVAGL